MATSTDLKMQMSSATTYIAVADIFSHTLTMQKAISTHLESRWLQSHSYNANGYSHTPKMQMATATHLEWGWLQASSDTLLVEQRTVLLTS